MTCPRCKGLVIETDVQMADWSWQRALHCISCGWYSSDPDKAAMELARREVNAHDEAVKAAVKLAGEKRVGRSSHKNPATPWRTPGAYVCDSGDDL